MFGKDSITKSTNFGVTSWQYKVDINLTKHCLSQNVIHILEVVSNMSCASTIPRNQSKALTSWHLSFHHRHCGVVEAQMDGWKIQQKKQAFWNPFNAKQTAILNEQ